MRDVLDISPSKPPSWRLTGRHVLAILIAFFGVVFGVNGYFLFSALSTHTGVVAVEPYRKGLAYNTRIAASEQQEALGWSDAIQLGMDGWLVVSISDRDGLPVSGLSLSAVLSRPSTAHADVALRPTETSSGRYSASAGAPAPGTWIVAIEARGNGDQGQPIYRARRRLWLKP